MESKEKLSMLQQGSWHWLLKPICGLFFICILLVVLSRFFIHPWTLQGKFDQVHLGMNQSEVAAILGPPLPRPEAGCFDPKFTFKPVWTLTQCWGEDKEIMYHLQGDPATDFVFDLQACFQVSPFEDLKQREDPILMCWSTNTTCIFIEWGRANRVVKKTLVQVELAPWQRLQMWLGWTSD